jgi:Tol biopolymer transport system component
VPTLKRLIPLLLAIVVIGVVTAADASPRQASRQEIAFERWVGDGEPDEEIWVMGTDGTNQRRLAKGCCYTWSSDGKRIAFLDDRLRVINVDGTGSKVLADVGNGYSLSPDWRRVAFPSDDHIWVADIDGSRRVRLTSPPPQSWDMNPQWSPNGKLIVFERHLAENGREGLDIFVVKADGTGERRLTYDLGNMGPAWAPSSTRIAYSGYTDQFQLYVVNVDGSGRRQLTHTEALAPSWSPTGSKIVFVSGGEVHTIRPDGRRHKRVARGRNDVPRWAPDARSIVFRRETRNQWDVHVTTVSGEDVTNLTHTAKPLFEDVPAWSPAAR